ncbi:MAG: hypothetical protein KAR33_00550 [Candidatus Thorarchaeota archaeon]|nr:hypothetical protein [Candidatus Thorarchaeota archaeon]
MGKLVCALCGEETAVPIHCNREMSSHQDGEQLVCWMGAGCGVQDMPQHCGEFMKIKE